VPTRAPSSARLPGGHRGSTTGRPSRWRDRPGTTCRHMCTRRGSNPGNLLIRRHPRPDLAPPDSTNNQSLTCGYAARSAKLWSVMAARGEASWVRITHPVNVGVRKPDTGRVSSGPLPLAMPRAGDLIAGQVVDGDSDSGLHSGRPDRTRQCGGGGSHRAAPAPAPGDHHAPRASAGDVRAAMAGERPR
jgi:hypothetical protein